MSNDPRLYAPSAARNRDPIAQVLRQYMPETGLVLEIASGSGEHIVHFATDARPGLMFQPSDPDAAARASIDDWVAATGLSNVRPALALDAASDAWPINHADMMVCINMIHIAPWLATVGLLRGASKLLSSSGHLVLYGPYRQRGRYTAPSNEAFDQDLRSRNPAWGMRDLEEVVAVAEGNGFAQPAVHPMPANNLLLAFARAHRD